MLSATVNRIFIRSRDGATGSPRPEWPGGPAQASGPHPAGLTGASTFLISSNVPSIASAVRADGVRAAGQVRIRQPGDGAILPVLPALRTLLPAGGLAKGSVVSVSRYGLLCLALMAGASAAGAWCGVVGVPEFGVVAAAGAGADPDRLLLVPGPGDRWPQVAACLLDGCEVVVVRPPAQPPARARQRLEAALRRSNGVMLVIGEWDGAPVRLHVAWQRWTGLGDGYGRLRACRAEVIAEGRGAASRPRRQRLWLPAPDGTVTDAEAVETVPCLGRSRTAGPEGGNSQRLDRDRHLSVSTS